MTHVLMMALNGALLWIVLRCAVPLLSIILSSIQPALAWVTDPFIEWVNKQFERAIPGTTVTVDELHVRMKPRARALQLWGWGRGRWLIGIARSIR